MEEQIGFGDGFWDEEAFNETFGEVINLFCILLDKLQLSREEQYNFFVAFARNFDIMSSQRIDNLYHSRY